MSKILILYTTAGIGHKKAAFAINEAFEQSGVRDVLLRDSLDYTNSFFKVSYLGVYLFLVKYIPTLWGFFYYILDNPFVYAAVKPLRRLTNHINSLELVRFLMDTKPQTIIVTHFFPLEVIAALKRKNIIRTKLIAVMTDYMSHRFWLSGYVDHYVVGSDYTRADLVKRGIRADRIEPFGIPCSRLFSEKKDQDGIRGKLGLSADKKVLFLLSGGFGVGPVKAIASYLEGSELDFQAIVVCGYNKRLKEEMEDFAKGAGHLFKIYGFVDNIDELMAASDVLISKSGGITVTEALNAGLPMIVVQPIPGQEMRNCKFLEKYGAAVRLSRLKDLSVLIKKLFSGGELEKTRENIRGIKKEETAERIAELAVRHL